MLIIVHSRVHTAKTASSSRNTLSGNPTIQRHHPLHRESVAQKDCAVVECTSAIRTHEWEKLRARILRESITTEREKSFVSDISTSMNVPNATPWTSANKTHS